MKKALTSLILASMVVLLAVAAVVSAGAQLNPAANVPSATGLSSPGSFPQITQSGPFGQGPTTGIAGGVGPYQPPGPGIAIGEPALSGPARGQSCYCIRAPCICPGPAGSDTMPGGPSPLTNPYSQPVQARAGQVITAAPGTAAGTGAKLL